MKKQSVLKTVARNPWEFVGWTLLLGYAFSSIRRGYLPAGAVHVERQGQVKRESPIRAPQDELGTAGKRVSPMGLDLTQWWPLLKGTYAKWNEDHAPGLGAALAYYTVFSLAPLLMIVIAIAGLVFG